MTIMKRSVDTESGFSYIDVLIAVAILLIGVMALLSAITYAVVGTSRNQAQLVAKQYAASTIESIFAARDLTTLTFDRIGNVGSPTVPGGVFPSGPQNIYEGTGRDGIVGTADDQAGPDGSLNTPDDAPQVPGFQRTITITDVPDPRFPTAPITMRQIDVTISYSIGNRQTQETFVTYIANYNR